MRIEKKQPSIRYSLLTIRVSKDHEKWSNQAPPIERLVPLAYMHYCTVPTHNPAYPTFGSSSTVSQGKPFF